MNVNNQKPKTIKIFLADGEPTGTKIVELSNWTGIAYLIPRNSLESTLNNHENQEDLNSQYVGEAEEFSKGIRHHNKNNKNNKDFWNVVMVFTSEDDNLTKAHVKYLESKIVQQVKNNNTVILQNESVPPLGKLPRTDIAQMKEN